MATADAAQKCRDQRGKDGFTQLRAPDLGQIGQRNADDQSGFNPLPQRDDECLQHVEKQAYCNSVAIKCLVCSLAKA